MKVEVLRGEAAKNKAITKLALRLSEEAHSLPSPNRDDVLAIIPHVAKALLESYFVLYQHGTHNQLDLDQPIKDICAKGASLVQGNQFDEASRATFLTFQSAMDLLYALALPRDVAQSHTQCALAGIAFGQADVRRTQVVTGLWGIMAEADQNSQTAKLVASNRVAGGKTRGDALREKARGWKERLLPVAIRLAMSNPDWDRQKLAVEVMFESDEKEVGIRSIEDWLKKEAEQPNGPIASRARKQAAKRASQVS